MSYLGIVTCPKCKTRVLPKNNGTCPNCNVVISLSKAGVAKKKKRSSKLDTETTKHLVEEKIEITREDWQKLIDLHEKLVPYMLDIVSLCQDVSYTSSGSIGAEGLRLFIEFEPIAKQIFIEDSPFGVKPSNKKGK